MSNFWTPPKQEDGRDYYSVSHLQMAQRCGYQRFLRYEEGKVVPPGFRQARGSAVHKVVAQNLALKRSEIDGTAVLTVA